jgi:hypothetical protein
MRITNLLNPLQVCQRGKRIWPAVKRLAGDSLARFRLPPVGNESRLRRLRDRHAGRRAFVVGNGPSLRIEDLDVLADDGELTIASNKIYLAFDQTHWRPTYYVAEDPLAIAKSRATLDGMAGPLKLFPTKALESGPVLKDSVYFPLIWEKFYPDRPRFSFDATKVVYWGSTVTYTAIQLAAYMGIREIYLIGVDFRYVPPQGIAEGDDVLVSEGARNHFHPDYDRPGTLTYPPNLQRHEKSYRAAAAAIESVGGAIFNATRGGALEIFPRVDFDSLF